MNDTDTYQLWPLVVVVNDCYDPQFAPFVLDGVRALPEEAFSLVFGFAGDRAREEVTLN